MSQKCCLENVKEKLKITSTINKPGGLYSNNIYIYIYHSHVWGLTGWPHNDLVGQTVAAVAISNNKECERVANYKQLL